MPPDGRFVIKRPRALHRVGFAAGSGITPILSIMASTLEEQPGAKFTLVYGNRRMSQRDVQRSAARPEGPLPHRLTLIHILSRQAAGSALLEGRIDGAKVRELMTPCCQPASMDEVFICGPEAMIDATERALLAAGLPGERVHTERFFASGSQVAPKAKAPNDAANAPPEAATNQLEVVLDGKTHHLHMAAEDHVLDAALSAGLDLPYSCKGGVCCTCRARVLEGQVHMDKNFTLEPWEIEKGFVLTCQARPLTTRVVVSYDER
jgi:ring-1,2-phenylacetyl-CoA epoxidase subunit PaaE